MSALFPIATLGLFTAGILADVASQIPDVGSPLTIIAAVAFGVWLMTKRKDSLAHEIIVTSVNDGKVREKADGEQIRQLMTQMTAMQAERVADTKWREESTRLQMEQAGKIGGLEKSVALLEQALAEERAVNTQLRERLTACEAEKISERAGRLIAEARCTELTDKLDTSEARLRTLKEAIAAESVTEEQQAAESHHEFPEDGPTST